jgi:hypothetical protein
MLAVVSPKHIITIWTLFYYLKPGKKDPDDYLLFEVDPECKTLFVTNQLNNLKCWCPLQKTHQLELLPTDTPQIESVAGSFRLALRDLPQVSLNAKDLHTSILAELSPECLKIGTFTISLKPTVEGIFNYGNLFPLNLGEDEEDSAFAFNSKYYLKSFASFVAKLPNPELIFYPPAYKLISYSETTHFWMKAEWLPFLASDGLVSLSFNISLFKKLSSYFSEFYKNYDSNTLIFSEGSEDFHVELSVVATRQNLSELPDITRYIQDLESKTPLYTIQVTDPKQLFKDAKTISSVISKEDDCIQISTTDKNISLVGFSNRETSSELVSSEYTSDVEIKEPLFLEASKFRSVLDSLKDSKFVEISTWDNQEIVKISSQNVHFHLLTLLTA